MTEEKKGRSRCIFLLQKLSMKSLLPPPSLGTQRVLPTRLHPRQVAHTILLLDGLQIQVHPFTRKLHCVPIFLNQYVILLKAFLFVSFQ